MMFALERKVNMQVKIIVDVQDCEQCPYHNSDKVWTADSFENVRKVYCSKLKKDVYSYLDWHETAIIPEDCEFKKGVLE
jgi:NMD protein affecting ribosome stability and mRNA decay